MKKTVYTFLSSLTVILLMAIAHSCILEGDFDCDCDTSDNQLTFQLSFADNQTTRQTRAAEEEAGNYDGTFNEDKIQTINAFLYQGNTLKWKVTATELLYDAVTNIATLPIPEGKKALFQNNTTITYDLYIVANNDIDFSSINEGADNLQALKDLVFQSPEFVTKGGAQAQSSFVMVGKKSQVINLNSPYLGDIDMKRVASKIRLRLVEVVLPGLESNGRARARLVHFANKSELMEGGTKPTLNTGDWKTTQYSELSVEAPSTVGGGRTTVAPFYAYANNWQADPTRETYIELILPVKQSTEPYATADFKYHIPITPQNLTGADAEYMNRLDRNYLYDIALRIKIAGTIEEPLETITGNYTIQDWSTQEVLVYVQATDYLVLSEQNIIMPNTSTYTITFNSSVPNVTLVLGSLKATYTYVPAGGSTPITQPVVQAQMPTVTVQPNVVAGTIVINSPIPVNYIPKDIEFKVTNGQTGMIETVKIRQYPATYYTTTKGVQSYMPGEGIRNQLPSGNTNPYMYAITSLASGGTYKDGTTPIMWGFPPTDNDGRTINSAEVSVLVSPKFEMASQFGASQRKDYANAQAQCQGYWEKAADGTVKTGWRLPTAGEIRYIDELQRDSNNPQGLVMVALYYWSSWSQYPSISGGTTVHGAYRMSGGTSGTYNSAYVRCIRDIKD